jgi:hypothetical protein
MSRRDRGAVRGQRRIDIDQLRTGADARSRRAMVDRDRVEPARVEHDPITEGSIGSVIWPRAYPTAESAARLRYYKDR